jgi:ketosteroid isomerase-like protein
MKRFISLTMIFVCGVILSNVAWAGDVEDIKKATLEHFATLNAGNVAAHIEHHLQGHTTFGGDGGLLWGDDSLEEEKNILQADFDAGLKLNLRVRHLDVKVYGNTAVVTGYAVGTSTAPNGKTEQVMIRRTAVLIKQGNKWKEVHLHSSPVVAGQSQ